MDNVFYEQREALKRLLLHRLGELHDSQGTSLYLAAKRLGQALVLDEILEVLDMDYPDEFFEKYPFLVPADDDILRTS